MREGMHDVEQDKRQERWLEGAKPAHGPWALFFSNVLKAAKPVWILYAACILALLTVCSMMGASTLNPVRPVSLSSTSMAISNGGSTLVVDRMRTRLLFVDDKTKVVEVIGLGRGVVPADEVTDVAIGDDAVYVADLTRMGDGKSVASEAVHAFSLDGTFLGTVWQTSYDEDEYRPVPSIVDLEADDSGVIMLRRAILGEHSRSVDLFHLGIDEPETPLRTVTFDVPFYDVNYEQSSGRLFVISFDGEVSVLDGDSATQLVDGGGLRCKGLDASGDRAILQDASSGELLLLDGIGGKPIVEPLESVTRPRSARLSGDVLCVALDDGSFMVKNLGTGDSSHISELTLAPRLFLRFSRYYLSLALLVLVIAIWAVRKMRGLLREKEFSKFRRVVISIVVAAICIVSSFLLSYSSYVDEREVRESQLLQMGSTLGYFATETLNGSIMRETQLIDALPLSEGEQADDTLLRTVNGLVLSAHETGVGVSCKLYVISEDGTRVHAVVSSDYDVVHGERVFDEELADALLQVAAKTDASSSDDASVAETAARSSTYLNLVRKDVALGMSLTPLISQDGTCRMVAQVSSQQLTFVRGFLKNLLGKMLAYGLFAIGFYLVTDEVLKLGGMLAEYRRLGGEDILSLHVGLTRPLTFLHGVAFSMDYALVAVMTRSLFSSIGVEASASMLAIPVFAASTGVSVSRWVGGPLTKRFPMRIVSLAFLAIGLVAQLICFMSIQGNRFEWYVVGKFLTSFGYGYVITALLELAARSQTDVDAASAGIEQAGRSSSIVAGIVGGILALLGSVWIYVFSAALGAVLLWGLWKALPSDLALYRLQNQNDVKSGGQGTVSGEVSNVQRFLRSPQMILISLFGLIPLAIAGGYKSYFLPLFLSSSSYTNTQISNYSVICNLALYEATKGLRSFRHDCDRWLLTWTSLAAIGVLFGLFARNQSPAWAVLAAILISILCWLAKRCRSLARKFGMIEYDLDFEEAYEAISWVDSFLANIRSVAMGAFLSLGTTNGCLALAVLMVASSLLFAVSIRPHYQRVREKSGYYTVSD